MTSHGQDYKNFSNYNGKSAGSIQGPEYNGPSMNVQKIPQYNQEINIKYGHGFQSYKQAYTTQKGPSNCDLNYNFKDCSGKVVGNANQNAIHQQAQYSQAKYNAV